MLNEKYNKLDYKDKINDKNSELVIEKEQKEVIYMIEIETKLF